MKKSKKKINSREIKKENVMNVGNRIIKNKNKNANNEKLIEASAVPTTKNKSYKVGDLSKILSSVNNLNPLSIPDPLSSFFKVHKVNLPEKKLHKSKDFLSEKNSFKKNEPSIESDHCLKEINNSENSKEFLKKEDTKYSNEQEEEKEIRTVFVGNLPNSTSRKEIKHFFGKVGKVESVRIRSLAFLNPSQPRKVSFIKKELHPGRSSFNAYVVFKTVEDARNALRLSNSLLGEKHIRVDLAANKPNDTSKTIFAGGLPFSIEEEEVRKLFNDCGIIDYVRIVRDKKINIGKGFAFVKFMDKGSVDLALRRHGAMYHGRKIRVFRALKTERLNKTKENSFKGLETKKVLLSGAERRIANKKFRIKQKK